MGRSMIRQRLAVFLLLAVGVCLAACQKKPRVPAPEPEVTVELPPEPEPDAVVNLPAPVPPPPPPPLPAPRATAPPEPSLADADGYFEAGRYGAASISYSQYLREAMAGRERDKALYRLAVSQALATTGLRGMRQAETTLEGLIEQHPDSPYAAEGKLLLSLLRENRRLRGEGTSKDETIRSLQDDLERLKKIDMDRRIPPFE